MQNVNFCPYLLFETFRFYVWNAYLLFEVCAIITPHLNRKKPLTIFTWDFEHVLDTMDPYWVCPDENFCSESTRTRWRCNQFSKKWPKSNFDTTLTLKKPLVTPKFCGRNLSQMHHFGNMNLLSLSDPFPLLYRIRKIQKWGS